MPHVPGMSMTGLISSHVQAGHPEGGSMKGFGVSGRFRADMIV